MNSEFKTTLRRIIADVFEHMQKDEYLTVSAFMGHFNCKAPIINDIFFEMEKEGWFKIHEIEIAQYHYKGRKQATKIYIKK